MSKIVSGKLIASDAAINVDIGFIPDYVELVLAIGGTELVLRWWKVLYDAAIAAGLLTTGAASAGKWGVVDDGAGVLTHNASAAAGIIAYDEAAMKAIMPAPDGNGEKSAALTYTFATAKAAGVTPTARTTAVVGTVIRPTTSNGFLYECTVSAAAMTALTEPTWPTVLGDTVSDGSNTWICREEKLKLVGGKGFTLGVDKATNSEIIVFRAEQHDRSADMGDADTSSPVSYEDE